MKTRVCSAARLLAGAALALLLGTAEAQAASNSASATANILANVVSPGTVVVDQQMSFGDFVVGPVGGTVVVPPSGAATSTGDVILLAGITGGTASFPAPAVFHLLARPKQHYSFALGAGPIPLTGPGGQTMLVNALTMFCTSTNNNCTGNLRLDNTGQTLIEVGGTLSVAGNQAAGTYSGRLIIIVTFN